MFLRGGAVRAPPSLRRFHERAVDLHRDASVEKVDREHEKALVRIATDEDPLHVGERTGGNADPLTVAQIWIGEDGQTSSEDLPDRLDFTIWHHVELIPALPQNAHQAPRLADFDIARLVHHAVDEEIAGKEGNAGECPDAASSVPGVDVGQEELEPLGGELLVHKLLAVAVSPQDVPAFACHRTWQGFAPFGSSLLR